MAEHEDFTPDFPTEDVPIIPEPIPVPRSFHQLGILVLDGSGSMTEMAEGKISKAEAVHLAVRELLGRMKISIFSRNFSIAVVTFDHEARVHTPVTPVEDQYGNKIDDNADYDPLKGHAGGTRIGNALKKAHAIAEDFLSQPEADNIPHSVVIVVMSDGESQDDPVPVADKIKENPKIKICSTLFARKGESKPEAQAVLRDIASSPMKYKTVYDAEALRKFFEESVSSGKM